MPAAAQELATALVSESEPESEPEPERALGPARGPVRALVLALGLVPVRARVRGQALAREPGQELEPAQEQESAQALALALLRVVPPVEPVEWRGWGSAQAALPVAAALRVLAG